MLFSSSGGLRYASTTGYFLTALQAEVGKIILAFGTTQASFIRETGRNACPT
ncbi:MAG: hypothetical protein AABN95_21640 [Acidobacteriota bacterium]